MIEFGDDDRINGCSAVETDAKLGRCSFLNTGKPRFALWHASFTLVSDEVADHFGRVR
jgi:hypothetical protein